MTGRALPALGARSRRRSGRTSATTENRDAAQRGDADAPRRVLRDPRRRRAPTASCWRPRAAPWDEAVALGETHGYRNAQATVLAPTGTISLPDGLRHDRRRARLLAGQVQGAGRRRADDDRQPHRAAGAARRSATTRSRSSRSSPTSTSTARSSARPGCAEEHLPVFDVAVGERAISHMGHIKMMGAVQPFISRRDLEDRQPARVGDRRGHRRRLHPGLAAGHQGARDLPRRLQDRAGAAHRRAEEHDVPGADADIDALIEEAVAKALAEARAAAQRACRASASRSRTSSRSAGTRATSPPACTRTASVGEIFLTDIGKEGSTLRGMMNAFATAISIALQYGVPLETLVRKFSYMRFEPEGITSNPEIPFAKSMPDYIMRWLASRFLDADAPGGARHPHAARSARARSPRTRRGRACSATRPARRRRTRQRATAGRDRQRAQRRQRRADQRRHPRPTAPSPVTSALTDRRRSSPRAPGSTSARRAPSAAA